ncbi:MAG: hypothetical protein V7767_04760 [Leeuwenhoekiella sp.]
MALVLGLSTQAGKLTTVKEVFYDCHQDCANVASAAAATAGGATIDAEAELYDECAAKYCD